MEADLDLFVIVSDLEFKMGTSREVISLSLQCVEVFFRGWTKAFHGSFH